MEAKASKDVRAGGGREEGSKGEDEEKGQQHLGLPSPQPAMREKMYFYQPLLTCKIQGKSQLDPQHGLIPSAAKGEPHYQGPH